MGGECSQYHKTASRFIGHEDTKMNGQDTIQETSQAAFNTSLLNQQTMFQPHGIPTMSGSRAMDKALEIPSSSTPLYRQNTGPLRHGPESCSFHRIENAINIMYSSKLAQMKSLGQIQSVMEREKQPCLFDGAYLFGGSQCSEECFNGICLFHWTMMNVRVGVCEGYTALNKKVKDFRHYEFLVDKPMEDRSFQPIFPYIDQSTTVYDLLLGFSYATSYGLETTKKNEGAAMTYALYYMINSNCRYDWLLRSTHWIEMMTGYLMAFVFYNDNLLKMGVVPGNVAPARNQLTHGNAPYRSVLENFFAKNVLIRSLSLPYTAPVPQETIALLTRNELARTSTLANPVRPGVGGGDGGGAAPGEVETVLLESDRLRSFRDLNIFMAPLILGFRASTLIMDRVSVADNYNVSIFDIEFAGTPVTTTTTATAAGNGDTGEVRNFHAKVFGMEGPILHGVATQRSTKSLPFMSRLPKLTMSSVVQLAGTSNIEPQEDRIFASTTARHVVFRVDTNTEPGQYFRLVNSKDVSRYV